MSKIIIVKSCRRCPFAVIYKPNDDNWDDETRWTLYCGKFDVSEESKIKNVKIIDPMCPLKDIASLKESLAKGE